MDFEAAQIVMEEFLKGLKEIFATKKDIIEIVKSHDDWKYSIHLSIGPADNRKEIKVRGDDLEGVKADLNVLKSAVE